MVYLLKMGIFHRSTVVATAWSWVATGIPWGSPTQVSGVATCLAIHLKDAPNGPGLGVMAWWILTVLLEIWSIYGLFMVRFTIYHQEIGCIYIYMYISIYGYFTIDLP